MRPVTPDDDRVDLDPGLGVRETRLRQKPHTRRGKTRRGEGSPDSPEGGQGV